MTSGDLLDALLGAYAPHYPVRLSDQARNLGGRTTIVASPAQVEYDTDAPCPDGEAPFVLRVQLLAVAPGTGEAAVRDLIGQAGAVAALARGAGFTVDGWEPSSVEEQPALLYTITAVGKE